MDNLVSIIMPVFNAEKYLHECIESILHQTYSSFELIVIDDGSVDRSLEIVEAYAHRDNRIRVFPQRNAGVSHARNKGLQESSGVFIIFVDSDDILPPDSLAERVNAMGNADLVVARYTTLNNKGELTDSNPCTVETWDRLEAMRNIALDGSMGYQGYIWNKLYRRSIVEKNNLAFAPGIAYNEDKLFNLQYLENCQTVRLINNVVYIYRQNDFGAMGKIHKMADQDADVLLSEFTAFDRMLKIAEKIDEALFGHLSAYAMLRASNLHKQLPSRKTKRIRSRLRELVRIHGIAALKCIHMPLKKRIKILCHVVLGR